jgi:hypothetical protein
VTPHPPFNPREFLKVLCGSSSEKDEGSIRRYLIKYVDAWLDSALRKDGSETPSDRSFGLELNNTRGLGSNSWFRDDVANCYKLFCEESDVSYCYPHGAQHPKLIIVPKIESVQAEARRLLVALLESPYAHLIAKCRNADCRRYFYLPESHRKSYKNGLFCSGRCNRHVTAFNRTKASRHYSRGKVIDLAARSLRKYQGKPVGDMKKLRRLIADEVHEQISKSGDAVLKQAKPLIKGRHVRSNFITRHWDEVRARAQEIADGKA